MYVVKKRTSDEGTVVSLQSPHTPNSTERDNVGRELISKGYRDSDVCPRNVRVLKAWLQGDSIRGYCGSLVGGSLGEIFRSWGGYP